MSADPYASARVAAARKRVNHGKGPVCPHCKRPFPPWFQVGGSVRQRVVDLVASRPDGITTNEIMDIVYAQDPNGGPQSPNVIRVLVHVANRQLKPQGYFIAASWKGRGARYRLMKWSEVK